MAFVGKSEKRRIVANWAWSKCVLPRGVRKLMRKLPYDYIPSQVPSMLKGKWRTWGSKLESVAGLSCYFFSRCKLKNERRSLLTGSVPEAFIQHSHDSWSSPTRTIVSCYSLNLLFLIPVFEKILLRKCPVFWILGMLLTNSCAWSGLSSRIVINFKTSNFWVMIYIAIQFNKCDNCSKKCCYFITIYHLKICKSGCLKINK